MSKEEIVPESSYISLAEYDTQSRVMTLTFKTGSQFNYLNVFESTWLSFKQADNHGVYYSRAIKGRLQSVPVKKSDVGQKKSTALKAVKQRKTLDAGLTKLTNRSPLNGNHSGNARKRPAPSRGTVPDSLFRQ